MSGLILSIFPGLDVLGMGFEADGFCVVKGPDVIWGGDVRGFHPPAGRFDGIIGGDPCQAHSALANLVRAKGLETTFGDLSGEFQRVVEEAKPAWFLRENVPQAPSIAPEGYAVATFLLDHSTMDRGDGTGHEQMRTRRFWFGQRGKTVAELRRWIDFALVELPEAKRTVAHEGGGAWYDNRNRKTQAVSSHSSSVPVKLSKGGKVKATAIDPFRYSLEEMLELQGIPKDVFDHSPLTVQGKRKLVGNAVPLPMARALAKAVLEATK